MSPRENNQAGDFTHTWEYDDGGNIQNRKEYDYTTGSLDNATPTDEITYTYDDVFWRDLLTEYDGKEIDRDEIGNPLTYDGWTYTWEHGRQLASAEKDGRKWLYTYDANGMRTQKGLEGGTAPTTYVYNGSQLSRMEVNNNVLDFTYDANGTPLTLTYNGTTYYYVTNLQGDVIGIRDANGALKVSYEYNAWGKEIAHSGNTTLYTLNPLRYRGYVYDLESGLYYLQSRYYDPEIGRFINGDGFAATGQGFTGNNMFAYCGNNPIANIDSTGALFEKNAGISGGAFAGAPGGYGGGGTYVGPSGSHIARPTTPSSAPLIIPFIPPSTTYGIDELRAETIAIRKLQALEDAQAVAITVSITQSNEAVYYGADMKGGTWKIVTPPMTYQETKAWVILTALTQSYGKGANWGLYTSKSFDACTMAWDLGLGGMPISHFGKPGEYPHYHVFGYIFLGVYKHFHIWYGSIYGE